MLQDMAGAGVRSLRLVLTPPFDQSLAAIREAQAAGLSVLLNINPNFRPFFPRDVVGQPVRDNIAWPLSRFDPAHFERVWRELWRRLEAEGLQVAGIEFGNEINWAEFNADLAADAAAGPDAVGRLDTLPERAAFLAGMRNYVEGLRVLRRVRDEGGLNRMVPLVSAGFATVSEAFARSVSLHFVAPEEALAVLRGFGLDSLIDGYGIHFYPSGGHRQAGAWDGLTATMEFCLRHAGDRPCWVTEWGVSHVTRQCPDSDPERLSLVQEVKGQLGQLVTAGRLKASYYFDWGSRGSAYSVWRCGALTSGGATALAPMGTP
ncbi:hypothetical protein [Siccirubricoccus deserti]|uniref:Uncharacterized protein n=1 Tax=Siccirubricoccus deserti TaxID=2013562 RepID=A0A9X0R3M8_9PROT|nr:hypothetical protein [Siccirubricoccus deserti]MBC4019085.1 hypothetical protein [Siccirubricoccus deserti]